jgi:hypothetical protein
MDEIAKEYDVIVLGTGEQSRNEGLELFRYVRTELTTS